MSHCPAHLILLLLEYTSVVRTVGYLPPHQMFTVDQGASNCVGWFSHLCDTDVVHHLKEHCDYAKVRV